MLYNFWIKGLNKDMEHLRVELQKALKDKKATTKDYRKMCVRAATQVKASQELKRLPRPQRVALRLRRLIREPLPLLPRPQ